MGGFYHPVAPPPSRTSSQNGSNSWNIALKWCPGRDGIVREPYGPGVVLRGLSMSMRINEGADALRPVGLASMRADQGAAQSVSEDADTPKFSVFGTLASGLSFALGQPIDLVRICFLPLTALLLCQLVFSYFRMPFMVVVPEDFGPIDWIAAGLVFLLFLWAWASLWGGLFDHFFGKRGRSSWRFFAASREKLRLVFAFLFLFAIPAMIGALLFWAQSADHTVQLAAVDATVRPSGYFPTTMQDGADLIFPYLMVVGGMPNWVLFCVGAVLAIYLIVRFAFLVPDAVAKDSLNPVRAWSYTSGFTWRLAVIVCFSVPALLMLLGGPMTLGIFATYYLYPELLTVDVKVSLFLNDLDQLLRLWPTFIGFLVGLCLCCAFWAGALGTLYQTRQAQ